MDDTTEEYTTYAFKSWDSPIGIIGTIFLLIVILLVFRMAIFFLLEYLRASLVTFPLLLCSRFSSAYTAALIANFSGTCSPGAILVNNDLSIPFTVAVLLGAVLLAQYAGTLLGGHSGYTAISRFFVASALGTALLAQEFIVVPPEELLDNYWSLQKRSGLLPGESLVGALVSFAKPQDTLTRVWITFNSECFRTFTLASYAVSALLCYTFLSSLRGKPCCGDKKEHDA